MKKIPALVLLSVLLVNTAGFYVYYAIALQRIHTEMRAGLRTLPEEQLTRLVLARQTYEDSRVEDDEIRLSGKMYDIARLHFKGDSVIVLAMHDEKEENFLSFANEIFSRPFKQDTRVTYSVLQFIGLIFVPGQQINLWARDWRILDHTANQSCFFSNVFVVRDVPPPRLKC